MDIKATIAISRTSHGEIKIHFSDKASRVGFLEVTLTPAEFTNAITGLYGQEVPAIVRGLDKVGKTLVRGNRTLKCPLDSWDKTVLSAWLEENGKEDGWIVSSYLGSQNSIVRKDNETHLNYEVYKYV